VGRKDEKKGLFEACDRDLKWKVSNKFVASGSNWSQFHQHFTQEFFV